MINNLKIVGLVPLRGGSKSIPYKNIKTLAGKPLCYWVLKAATDSKYIDEVWVSTEDKKIKDTVLSFGLGVKVIDRPAELAQDNSSTESVMMHFAKEVSFDILITIQATSPLTENQDLDLAIEQFVEGKMDSMVSGVQLKRFFWTHEGVPLNYNPLKRPLRQEWNGTIMENGAFYITKREILDTLKNRLGGKIGVFKMPEHTAVEIDEPEDWLFIENRLSGHFKKSKA
ncbi:MAG: acylneuraminate cytidylyltransferase family protein [Candidatus Taylorbacteria bacterium]|nr:acylneuraminate cytidylyltransferase family protein [Candidatus Taylorbacteria bacterium]